MPSVLSSMRSLFVSLFRFFGVTGNPESAGSPPCASLGLSGSLDSKPGQGERLSKSRVEELMCMLGIYDTLGECYVGERAMNDFISKREVANVVKLVKKQLNLVRSVPSSNHSKLLDAMCVLNALSLTGVQWPFLSQRI